MSYRFGIPRNASSYTFGVGGLGSRGDAVSPLPGEHGPGILSGDPVLPGEAADEFMYRVTTRPPLLTLFRYRDKGEVDAEGPDGVHTGVAERRKNGVVYGSAPFYVYIGVSGSVSGGVVADDAVASGALSPAPPGQLAGGVVAADAVASGDIVGQVVRVNRRGLTSNLSTARRPNNLNGP
jgi:hypothetical protein